MYFGKQSIVVFYRKNTILNVTACGIPFTWPTGMKSRATASLPQYASAEVVSTRFTAEFVGRNRGCKCCVMFKFDFFSAFILTVECKVYVDLEDECWVVDLQMHAICLYRLGAYHCNKQCTYNSLLDKWMTFREREITVYSRPEPGGSLRQRLSGYLADLIRDVFGDRDIIVI